MYVLEPDRLRLLKNRDSDYLAILAAFQDYQLPFFTKNNLFLRLLLDYQLPISGNVIGNRDYQLLILSNRSGSSQRQLATRNAVSLLPAAEGYNNGTGDSFNFKIIRHKWFSVPGAFKLDPFLPIESILFQIIFNFFLFILGGYYPRGVIMGKRDLSNFKIE